MDIEMLKTIAQQAQSKMRHVYELYDLGEPPSVTPGIVEAVLEAAEGTAPTVQQPSHYIGRGWGSVEGPVTVTISGDDGAVGRVEPVALSSSTGVKSDKSETEAAVIARLRELATDRIMPKQTEWNAKRGDLPNAALLYENWGGRKWAEWAELAGLVYAGPRGSGKRKTQEAAGSPQGAEDTFRGEQISDNVARYAVNGAPADS